MKQNFPLLLLYILNFLLFQNPLQTHVISCEKNLYCMACNSDSNICDACFNWGTGTILARALKDQNCKTLLPANLQQKDCKYYSGTMLFSQVYQEFNDCLMCNKSFLIWDNNNKTGECRSDPVPGCSKIQNCLTTVCYLENGLFIADACRICKKGHYGLDVNLVYNNDNSVEIGWNSCMMISENATSNFSFGLEGRW